MAWVRDDGADLEPVLEALDDADCRTIVEELDEPMTASEIAGACDIPLSSTYRKLDLLSTASLVRETTEIRADGHHASRYRTDFVEVTLALDDDRSLDVQVVRPDGPAARLETMWGEVRRET